MTTTHGTTAVESAPVAEARAGHGWSRRITDEQLEAAGLTVGTYAAALKLFLEEVNIHAGETDILDKHARTWLDYGKQEIDGYGAWAAIHHAQKLETLVYEGDAGLLFDREQPVLSRIANELTLHPDRRVRLLGHTMTVELALQVRDVLRLATEEVQDELVAAVKAGDTNA